MTWNDLKYKILDMTEEQRKTDVTFLDPNDGEYYKIMKLYFAKEEDTDVLDPGHPFLTEWG